MDRIYNKCLMLLRVTKYWLSILLEVTTEIAKISGARKTRFSDQCTAAELQAFYDAALDSYLLALKHAPMNLNGRDKTDETLRILKSEVDFWRSQLDGANGKAKNTWKTYTTSG